MFNYYWKSLLKINSILILRSRSAAMSHTTWRQYIADHPQCNFKVTRDPLIATFTHPGLSHKVDRDGLTDIADVLSHVVDTQNFPLYYPYKNEDEKWFQWGQLFQERSIFASSIKFTTSRSLYNRQLPKWPLEAKCILRYVGNSTVAHQMESYIPGSKEPLVTYLVQMVTVDPMTRKSKPLPNWFINKYKDQCSMKTGFQLKIFPRPKKTFVCRRQVMWLDTDFNNHTNFASYVRYAIDCLGCAIKHETEQGVASKSDPHSSSSDTSFTSNDASHTKYPNFSTDAVSTSDSILNRSDELHSLPVSIIQMKSSSGGLKGMTRDILKRGIKSLKVCYANECVEGDIIDVHVWQEENEVNIVRCSVERGSQIICQLILEYFGPLAKL